MVISIAAEKLFLKIPFTFRIKSLNKLGIKEKFLSSMKDIYENPTANIILKRINM